MTLARSVLITEENPAPHMMEDLLYFGYHVAVIVAVNVTIMWIITCRKSKTTKGQLDQYYGKLIALEANISCGKSTLLTALSKRNDVIGLPERISTQILKLFYSDYDKYSFVLQMMTITRRINDIRLVKKDLQNTPNKVAVHDRSLFGDLVFAMTHFYSGKINQKEAQCYAAEIHLDSVIDAIKAVDTIVYLHADPERCQNAVKSRADVDSKVPLDYLQTIHQLHFHGMLFMKSQGLDIRFIDWNGFGTDTDFFRGLREENKGSVVIQDKVRPTDSSNDLCIDYDSHLVDLHNDSLPLLDNKYHKVLSKEYQDIIVKHLMSGKRVTLNNVGPSLINAFTELHTNIGVESLLISASNKSKGDIKE